MITVMPVFMQIVEMMLTVSAMTPVSIVSAMPDVAVSVVCGARSHSCQ
jgi:hypothetical protein